MGRAQKRCIPPDKYANLELIKVQNFLHLTPPAIKKDCEALKSKKLFINYCFKRNDSIYNLICFICSFVYYHL